MNRTHYDRLEYRQTQEFKDEYRSYKIRNRISEDDDRDINLFGCLFLMSKLPEINPYNKYRYNKNDDNKIEVG
jgi:hypothetical protein